MKVIFISDVDVSYGAPKAMMEVILTLKNNYSVTPILLTCSYGILNKMCEENQIENYVTGHKIHMFTKEKNIIVFCVKYILRFIRYKFCIWLKVIYISNSFINICVLLTYCIFICTIMLITYLVYSMNVHYTIFINAL